MIYEVKDISGYACGVCAGVTGCTLVYTGVCAGVCAEVQGCAGVCLGICRCAQVCVGKQECARFERELEIQKSLMTCDQRTLIHILYEFF